MTNLRSEIEKIASCAADKIISKKDIDTVATPTTEAVVFDLTDALARGDTDNAAQALTDLLALREEPVKLNSLICSQMRGLYLASLAAQSGKTPAMLAEMMNYKSEYPARRLMESAKLRDANDWLEAVKLSAEADIEMKRTGVNRQAILTALVMRLGTVRA